ncbi:hypothetical protein E4U40_002807 [Claviceps sp. LM458 group G5]|nr:hypothetical protein E4U40_002807 [Claviceps sp. LM458 group G5]
MSPIHHSYLAIVPITKTTSLVGLTNQTNKARIFYQNGTETELEDGVFECFDRPRLSAPSRGPHPDVRRLITDRTDRRLTSSTGRAIVASASPQTEKDHFVSLRHITKINEGNDTIIPPDCIRVLLTPECYASLREWTKESGGHKYALDTQCYPTLMPDDKYGNKKLGKATQTPRLPGASVTHRTSHRSLFTPPPIS